MTDRFEKLTTGTALIYKGIQRIKKARMNSIGLKGTQVMCIYYLDVYDQGLTASELCGKCKEDKAGISRTLAELEEQGFIGYDNSGAGRRYRARAVLTEKGKKYAVKVRNLILGATEEIGAGITEAEREVFYRVLFRIADNLAQVCASLESQ